MSGEDRSSPSNEAMTPVNTLIRQGYFECQADDGSPGRFYFRIYMDEVQREAVIYLLIHDHHHPSGCSCGRQPFDMTLQRQPDGMYFVEAVWNPRVDWSRTKGLGRASVLLAVLTLQADIVGRPEQLSTKAYELGLALVKAGVAESSGKGFISKYSELAETHLAAAHILRILDDPPSAES